MSKARLLAVLCLAGCAIQDNPPPDLVPAATASITLSTGGMLGQTSTTIFGNDWVVVQDFNYGKLSPSEGRTVSGAFARAALLIRSEGKRVKAGVVPDAQICMDYGTDMVRASPPISGFDAVSATCPNKAVTALIANLLTAVAVPR